MLFNLAHRTSVLRSKFVSRQISASLNGFGDHVFKGAIAAPFLQKQGLPPNALDTYTWTTDGSAEKVAAAILEWAKSNNATLYTHWFQPLGSAGVRHGQTGQVHNSMFEFDKSGLPVWRFDAKNLLQGETDGSSFPNGGMRQTHCAGAYITLDPTSPIFLRGDTVFIPSCLSSYDGHALDQKIPLLRAADALSREGTRLLKNLGFNVNSLVMNIGLEQELFLVPRDAYNRRPDLQMAGRTITGKMSPRGQEMSDHYMAPPSLASPALACMQEIQRQCFNLGIPLRTRHREVAPNQYEFAPLYGTVTTQIDQNMMVMQIIEEVASSFGLAALLQEKPFQGVNGSGKHNNWSIATDCGTNLLNVKQLAKNSGSSEIFPVIMAAILKGVYQHGDLMRLSIATPGNDFRLGACEAPPAIVSTHLGEEMTRYLQGYADGEEAVYQANTKTISMGASVLMPLTVPAEDRNRTSLFPYGGHRFEFRAVGSSQNVSLVNTVLATITANSFRQFSDAIEAGESPKQVAQKALKDSWNVIFNGNGYDTANQETLLKRGVWCINSNIDAIRRYTAPENVALFERMGVLEQKECEARQAVLYTHYIGTVEVEANCLLNMLQQHVIPAVREGDVGPLSELRDCVDLLKTELEKLNSLEDPLDKRADVARVLRLQTMVKIREVVDAAEAVVPAHLWTLATYQELLFLDHTLP
mmetsp:Transcript_88942/g.174049  ORF Transcript_88942/g.174049 Transcript_88942/m.174049 type:complete len:698 (-) Transcript_88942:95-2188(-)